MKYIKSIIMVIITILTLKFCGQSKAQNFMGYLDNNDAGFTYWDLLEWQTENGTIVFVGVTNGIDEFLFASRDLSVPLASGFFVGDTFYPSITQVPGSVTFGTTVTNLSATNATLNVGAIVADQIYANTISASSISSITPLSGESANDSLSTTGTNGFYITIGTAWTNGPQRGFATVPYIYTSSLGGSWGVQVYVTNYSGQVGYPTTVTNVKAFGQGNGGLSLLTLSGSNVLNFWVYSNSVVKIMETSGTVTIGTATNNQSQIDWQ